MAAHIDRNAIDVACKIRPVIKVEPTEEILIGLARARVLRCYQTWHIFCQFAYSRNGSVTEVFVTDRTLRCTCGDADLR